MIQLLFVIALFGFFENALAQPTLTHSSPSAISPKGGQITLYGTGLKEPLSLWCTPGAEAIFSDTSNSSAVCRITFPNPVAGIAALRVATRSGISGPLLVAIDDLPTIAANGKNKSLKQAQTIDLPIAIEGAAEELTSHFYRFHGKKGQTLCIDVIANRIGSRLDPLVRLLDASGRELIDCDDDPAIAPDSRFTHKNSSDGEYILEVRDAAYEGSSQHRYRLRVSESNLLESAQIRQYPTTLPATSEQEPNDVPGAATVFQFPSQLNGDFAKSGDRDIYQFPAKKGDHILIRSKTRSIGSPCDLLLRLAKTNSVKVADSKSDTPDEASINTTISEDGNYLLIVEELTGQGSSGIFYQLDVEPFAGFSVSTEVEKLDIPSGGQAEIKITAARREYKGPITFTIDGDVPGLRLLNDTMKEEKNEVQLQIKLPADAPVGKAFSFRFVGRANINGRDYTQPLSTHPALKKLFPMMHYPPPQLDGEIGLGIKPPLPTTTTAPTTKSSSSGTPARQ